MTDKKIDSISVFSPPDGAMDTFPRFEEIIERLNSIRETADREIVILEIYDEAPVTEDHGLVPYGYGAKMLLPKTDDPDLESQCLRECTEFVYEVMRFSRIEKLEFEVEFNDELWGDISNGVICASILEDILGEWERHIARMRLNS